jgi:hypothetical protein
MHINEVSVSMTHSLPGYNNITVGFRASVDDTDNPMAVHDLLKDCCLKAIKNEEDRRDQEQRNFVEIENAASLLRRNGFEVKKNNDPDPAF